jgi:hypothetical protein
VVRKDRKENPPPFLLSLTHSQRILDRKARPKNSKDNMSKKAQDPKLPVSLIKNSLFAAAIQLQQTTHPY